MKFFNVSWNDNNATPEWQDKGCALAMVRMVCVVALIIAQLV